MAAYGPRREAPPEHTFVIGLAMAGAVSAGAYTAGVLDTLLRALAEHERRFQAGAVDHRVVLKAMSGASAGSICAAMGAANLVRGIAPHDPDDPFRPGLPLLHELWVERIRLTDGAGRGLLGMDDLEGMDDGDANGDRPVASVLNAAHIDAEARALVAEIPRGSDREGAGFVADDLDIFLTTTNLMGVTYEVRFGGGGSGSGHVMASHGNVEHFRLTGLGGTPCPSPWLRRWADTGIALKAPPEPGARIAFGDVFGDPVPAPWARLVRAAVASGAFPVGLASRRLDVSYGALEARAWPMNIDPHERRPRPLLPQGHRDPLARFGYVAVDGGVANNEPFELARYAIREEKISAQRSGDRWMLADNHRDADTATRAVIMIDPFPEGPEMTLGSASEEDRQREGGMLYALKNLLPALINQARFKPTELISATDSAVHSRFLVAPSRKTPEGAKLRGAMAIASGFLGGFGGFLDRAFRDHDYRLGQQNCRDFLEKYFVLDGKNQIFAGRGDLLHGKEPGMSRILQVPGDALPSFVDGSGRFDPRPLPMADGAERARRWPGTALDDFEDAMARTGTRIERVATLLMREVGITNRFKRFVAKYLWSGVPFFGGGIRDALSVDLGNRIKGEMVARNQLLAARYFDDPRDRALYAAIVRNGNRRATPSELAAQSEIFVPKAGDPLATLTLDAADVEERAKAGIVRLWRYRGRWRLV